MNLFCVGVSHHTADVETRERFAGHAAVDRVLLEKAGIDGSLRAEQLTVEAFCRLAKALVIPA